MARSGMDVTKQSKVEDCRQWPMHYQDATGISKVSNISQLLSSFAKQMSIRLAADKTEGMPDNSARGQLGPRQVGP
jgi:hypothetical protein